MSTMKPAQKKKKKKSFLSRLFAKSGKTSLSVRGAMDTAKKGREKRKKLMDEAGNY